jgi:two-component system OmpR family sensor kinase
VGAGDPWRELEEVADSLARVSVQLVREMVTMPDAADLVARTMQAVALVGSLLTAGRRAAAERETHELRALVAVKSDFLRLTTHELRPPIGLMNGYLSLFREDAFGSVPEQMHPGLRHIEAAAAEMANLVEGLIEVARLEDRADALRREPCPLGPLVGDAIVAVEPEAAAKGITIEHRPARPEVTARVDGARLRIAVLNLVANAVKHSGKGTTVRVEVSAETELTIAVSDQGPGIGPDEAERIFESWHRAPDTIAPGLGLGLYIVQQIVTLHGGRVTLASTPGQGSTFSVVLPHEA